MEIIWEEITTVESNSLEKIFELYDVTFPFMVREPHSIFNEGLNYASYNFPNNFHILAGFSNNHLVSFVTGHYLAAVNSGFIVYLVTNSLFRKKGIGSETLKRIEKLLEKDAISAGHDSLKCIVLETERQELAHTDKELQECRYRDLFYQKNGYSPYERIDYHQPPLHSGEKSVPLNLTIKNIQNIKNSEEEVKEIIHAMYHEKYYLVNGIEWSTLSNCLEKMGIASDRNNNIKAYQK